MSISLLISIISAIAAIIFGFLSWIHRKKNDYESDGRLKTKVNELESDVKQLHQKNDKLEIELEKQIENLRRKFDKEITELKQEFKEQSEKTNKNMLNITELLAILKTKIEGIEKKL